MQEYFIEKYVRLPYSLNEQLKILAKKNGYRSLNLYMVEILQLGLLKEKEDRQLAQNISLLNINIAELNKNITLIKNKSKEE